MWLLVPVGLIALFAAHELVAFAVARALAGEPRRARAIVVIARRRAAALAFGVATIAIYGALCALAFAYYVDHGAPNGVRQLVVAEVKDGFDATGKLRVGDVILACDGTPLEGRGLVRLVEADGGKPVKLTIERDGLAREVDVQPSRVADHWVIGIVPAFRPIGADAGTALPLALRFPVDQVHDLATEARDQLAAPPTDPGGPKRIVAESKVLEPAFAQVWRDLMRLGVILLLALLLVDAVRVWRLDGARPPR